MKLLIDECLSPDLVTIARETGYDAYHIVHVGKASWKDWNVLRYAMEGDFVLVTNNASDFRRLYAVQPLHVGLVIIVPNVGRVVQRRLFRTALGKLATSPDLVNQVLEVDLDGENVTFTLYDLPPDTR